jgi:hypothetical protein
MQCPNCTSNLLVKKGFDNGKQRLKCKSCGVNFYDKTSPSQYLSEPIITSEVEFSSTSTKFVISSVQPNVDYNNMFMKSLMRYCEFNNAELILVPTVLSDDYHETLTKFFIKGNVNLHPKLKLLNEFKISSSSVNPLSGLSSISKGDSIIIGHPQLQMTTLPVQSSDHPVIMTTTGTISEKQYSNTKTGYKAEFNHSMSAVLVELDGASFHIRHLNFDGVGFYDFERYYTANTIIEPDYTLTAIVTGDEHAIFIDQLVKEATYGKNGIVKTLKPNIIIRHDILDCYAVSHHHKNDALTTFKKYTNGMNDIAKELNTTVDFINETTPKGCKNIIVASNHVDHLTRWLKEIDIKNEPWNAVLYHFLMFKTLSHIKEFDAIPNTFELFSSEIFKEMYCNVEFLSRSATYKIHDIEISVHGDKGANGSKGTRPQFAMLPSKTIIGHSHSPGIEKGCYQVGTSSILNMEYNQGASSWMNTHCLIYKNGKRQLVNIINGKWRV